MATEQLQLNYSAEGPDRVAWLGELPAPRALTSYLGREGVTLVTSVRGQVLPPARLITLDAVPSSVGIDRADGRRVAIIHPDPGAAEAIAQALRAHGAEVVVASLQADSLRQVEALVPDAVLVDLADLHRSCWEFVRTLWSHPRLRFSPLLLTPPGSLHVPQGTAWDLPEIYAGLHTLSRDYCRVASKARSQQQMSLRLDRLGPLRTLRALMEADRPLRVRVDTTSLTLIVDVVGALVVGALGGPCGLADEAEPLRAPLLGLPALAALLACHEATVSVRVVEHPVVTNIMASLDAALQGAVSGERVVEPTLIGIGIASEPGVDPTSQDDATTSEAPEAREAPAPSEVPAPSDAPDLAVIPCVSPDPPMPAPIHSGLHEGNEREPTVPRINAAKLRAGYALAAVAVVGLLVWVASSREPSGLADHAPRRALASAGEIASGKVAASGPHARAEAPSDDDDELKDTAAWTSMNALRRERAERAAQLVNEANSYLKIGRHHNAQGRYVQALELLPGYPRAQAGLARLEIARGDGRAAIARAQRLVRLRPQLKSYWVLLGDAYESANMHKQARANWTRAKRLGSREAAERLQGVRDPASGLR